ncbi:MAG TPA: hypothetical protein VF306_03985 [Pirellulales bacterium]
MRRFAAGTRHWLCNHSLGITRRHTEREDTMPDDLRSQTPIRKFATLLITHCRRWLTPALTVAGLALAYAALRPDTWEAAQSMVVRNEAAGNLTEPGKFRHAEEMKTTQETILELASSREVLRQALVEVGPPAGAAVSTAWPTATDIVDLAELVELAPPKGAEFGKTEVLYLTVRDHDPARGLALVAAISRQLQARFQQLRDTKAQGMIDELAKAVSLAEADLQEATARLTALESSVGSDLAELRMLLESFSGESDLRRKSAALETELREAQLAQTSNRGLLTLLESAHVDQGRLLATPGRLLESQPSLKRLKEGLVDAQLHTAELSGGMSERHPLVMAAMEAEREIGNQLHKELEIACRGVQADLELSAARATRLSEQLADTRARLAKLAGLRAEYANLIASVKNRSALVEAAQRELAEARGSQAGAHSASLIYSIDAPQLGARPVGPGRAVIAVVGLLAGLVVGGGVLFLSVEMPVTARVSESLPSSFWHSLPTVTAAPTAGLTGAAQSGIAREPKPVAPAPMATAFRPERRRFARPISVRKALAKAALDGSSPYAGM